MENLNLAFNVLEDVYKDKAYASIQFNQRVDKHSNSELAYKIIYGVLENSVKYDYIIDKFCKKRPKLQLIILLKIAIYVHNHVDSIKDYTIVNLLISILNNKGKNDLRGFFNAVVRRYFENDSLDMRFDDPLEQLSFDLSKPLWLCKEIVDEYGFENAYKILKIKEERFENIRINLNKITSEEIEKILTAEKINFEKTDYDSYLVNNNKFISDLFKAGYITFQDITSMMAVKALNTEGNCEVLDMCAAPGGKAIYISELNPSANIIACDIHEHRLELLNSYIKRMNSKNITVKNRDATVLYEKYKNRFDYIILDAPCSGMGLINKKPDIMLNKDLNDVISLAYLQKQMIKNAVQYLKVGGVLVYSTCTILRKENRDVINTVLSDDFILDKTVEFEGVKSATLQILFSKKGYGGFYISKIKRIR